MLKKLKRTACTLSAIAVGITALVGCNKVNVPKDPHEAVALAYNTTFKSVAGFDYYKDSKGIETLIENYKKGAIDENLKIRLKEVKGFGNYDNIIKAVSPEISLNAAYDSVKPSYKLGVGAASQPLNIDVNGLLYMDKDQAIFGLPDISKLYSMDFAAFAQNDADFSSSWESIQDTFSTMPEYTAASNKLTESLANHLLNDYYDAWLLCDVQRTENKETFTLSDGSNAECEEYTISVKPEAVKKGAEILFGYLRNETTIKDFMETNPSIRMQDKYSDTSSYDKFLESLDNMQSDFEKNFSMDNPVNLKVYAGDNLIRKAILEVTNTENNVKAIFEATALGKEHPLDVSELTVKSTSVDGNDSSKDLDIAKITFKATEGDEIAYDFNASLSSTESDNSVNITLSSTENKNTGDGSCDFAVFAPDNSKLTLSYKGKNTVNEKGKSYTSEINDLSVALTTSEGSEFSATFDGKIDVNVLDSIETPTADSTVSSDEDMNNAIEEIKEAFSSKVDLSSALQTISSMQ